MFESLKQAEIILNGFEAMQFYGGVFGVHDLFFFTKFWAVSSNSKQNFKWEQA